MTFLVPDRIPQFSSNSGAYRFGLDFDADVDIVVPGVAWYWVSGGPSSVTARLYSGTTQVRTQTMSGMSGVDRWIEIIFSSEYNLSAGTELTAAVEIADGNYKYDNSGYLPVFSTDGHVEVLRGRHESGLGASRPVNTWDGAHGLSVVYSLAGSEFAGGQFLPFFN